jgi:hypothetical protein
MEVKTPEDENYLKWLSAGILVGEMSSPTFSFCGINTNTISGGTDTSYGTLLSFFAAMVHNPEAQKKAQAEIDGVVGHDRLPTFEDRPHLPYLEGIVKEIYRCYVVGPLGKLIFTLAST